MSSSWAPSLTHPKSGVAVSRKTSVGRADATSAGQGDRLPSYLGPQKLRERRAHRPRGADPAEGDPARIRSETRWAWSLLGGPQREKAPSTPISARTCLGLSARAACGARLDLARCPHSGSAHERRAQKGCHFGRPRVGATAARARVCAAKASITAAGVAPWGLHEAFATVTPRHSSSRSHSSRPGVGAGLSQQLKFIPRGRAGAGRRVSSIQLFVSRI